MKNKIIFILILILNLLVLNLLKTHNLIDIITGILILINSCLIFIWLSNKRKVEMNKLYIFISYLLGIVIVYFDIYGNNIFILPNSGQDSLSFYNCAINNIYYTNYTYFLNFMYKIIGANRVMFQYINVVITLFTHIYFLKICDKMQFTKKETRLLNFIYCFLPNTLIISSLLLREPIIIFCNTLAMYFFIVWFKENKKIYALGAVVSLIFSTILHSLMIVALIPMIYYFLFYNHKLKKNVFSIKTIVLFFIIVILGIIIYRFMGNILLNKFSGISNFQDVSIIMKNYSTGGSMYLKALATNNSPIIFILSIPIKFIYFYLSPVPWSIRNINDVLAFVFSALPITLMLYSIILKTKKRQELEKFLITLVLIVGIAHSMSCFNAGAAMRHREKGITYILIAYGTCKFKTKREEENVLD